MLCQRCNKKDATVHIKQIIGGEKSELMLCTECAEKESFPSVFAPGDGSLFSGFFSDSILGSKLSAEKKTCPVCHSTGRDLAKSGRAGCAECYNVFSGELAKIIYGIHGNAVYTGVAPGKHTEAIKKDSEESERKKEIERLKKEQETAVSEENYERAAEIRDRIKEIENGKGEEK